MHAKLRDGSLPLVDKVGYAHGYKKRKGWRYYVENPKHSLNNKSIIGGEWANGTPRPDFRTGQRYAVKFSPEVGIVDIEVLVQTSLDYGAHVDFVSGSGNILYSITKTTLQSLIEQHHQELVQTELGEAHAAVRDQER